MPVLVQPQIGWWVDCAIGKSVSELPRDEKAHPSGNGLSSVRVVDADPPIRRRRRTGWRIHHLLGKPVHRRAADPEPDLKRHVHPDKYLCHDAEHWQHQPWPPASFRHRARQGLRALRNHTPTSKRTAEPPPSDDSRDPMFRAFHTAKITRQPLRPKVDHHRQGHQHMRRPSDRLQQKPVQGRQRSAHVHRRAILRIELPPTLRTPPTLQPFQRIVAVQAEADTVRCRLATHVSFRDSIRFEFI
jgi:hypothetical protein